MNQTDSFIFDIPECLRNLWWETCAQEFMSSSSIENFEAFLEFLTDYLSLKVRPITGDHIFDILIRSPEQALIEKLDNDTCSIINIGDEPTSVITGSKQCFLKSGQGFWVTDEIKLNPTSTTNEAVLDVLLCIKYKEGYSNLRKSALLDLNFSEDAFNERVLMSSGVCTAAKYSSQNAPYFDNAYISRSPWKTPTSEDSNILTTGNTSDFTKTIKVFKVPEEIIKPFQLLELNKVATEQDYYSRMNGIKGKRAIEKATRYVKTFSINNADVEPITVFNRPNLYSTARDNIIERYLGLHIDFTFKETISQETHHPNLMSINLGNEDRYFLYVNLTVLDLIELLKPNEGMTYRRLVQTFFQLYPNYPVIRLKINPGDAYIAPAMNLIHDGIGSKNSPDLHLMFRGYISSSPMELRSL
ncbi:MAG: hypothetical protein GKR77_05100 [Legionellales bacterium]|nr:hypothetical protein [Legionellales bacterium]